VSTPLTCPISLAEFDASVTHIDKAVTLPPAAYTDTDFYEFERAAVFDRSWLCVGRLDEIPNEGDFFTTTLPGEEKVIVTRGRSNEVHVISAVCQHRGMCVTAPVKRDRSSWRVEPGEQRGNTRTFRCPYHWWTYGLDGQLLGAPDMSHREDFTRSDFRLPALSTELWNGFIFANFDADAEPLGPSLVKATDLLANYHLEDMVSTPRDVLQDLPFNWKLMVENFMEGYHNDRLHHDLYDLGQGDNPGVETLTSGHMSFEFKPGSGVIAGWGRTAHRDRGLNPTQRGLFPPIETLTDEERWHMCYVCVPPSLLLGVSTDSAFWFVVTPTAAGTLTLSMSFVFPRATTEMRLFDQIFRQHVAGVDLFNDEDLPANIATQIGLQSRFAPRGPLAKGDLFLAQFNLWLLERYRAAEKG
jgi:phenylpropionate dioxygenase-like ring-hydroxylating dioxygenase large terminal subunit